MNYPAPHGDKLRALVENDKLPASDRAGVDTAIERYEAWTAGNEAIEGTGKELDETMFQEASATAFDLKLALPHSRYFLLCEWLDMEPVSTAITAIEEVIVLRKAKRLSANVRQRFSTATGRVKSRDAFERHLAENPFSPEAFLALPEPCGTTAG